MSLTKSDLHKFKERLLAAGQRLFNNYAFRFYLVSLVALIFPLTVLYHSVNCPIPAGIIFSLSDAAIVLLPYWFIKRFRWLTLIPIWFTVLFVEINLMMLNWGSELITFHSIYMTQNVDEAVTSNLPDLISFINYLLLIVAIAYTIYYFACRKRICGDKFGKRTIKTGLIGSLVMFVLVQTALQFKWQKDDMNPDNKEFSILNRVTGHNNIRTRDFIYKGYPIYVITNVVELFKSRELSAEEIARVEKYLSSMKEPEISDSTFINNRDKNLILIVVESLNTHAVNAEINGRSVMPNLKELIDHEGTISNLNIITQVKDGSSGDGQLIINTGLLPIKNGSANLEYGSSTQFISYPQLLPDHHPVVVVAEQGSTWAQRPTFLSFGFKDIHTSNNYAGQKHVTDDIMLAEASKTVVKQKEPFLMEIVSFTMHAPFDMVPVSCPDWIADSNISDTRKRYYNASNFFDTHLGKFFDTLKESGLWENSVIVVVADHSIPTDEEGNMRKNPYIPTPFIAANTGVTLSLDYPVGQVDIFPTVVEIMGGSKIPVGTFLVNGNETPWRGLGGSMLSDDIHGAADIWGDIHGTAESDQAARFREAFEVSDLIIRGNYLKDRLAN